jgi:hypothetical protein
MEKKQEYSTIIKSRDYMYLYLKKAAELHLKGLNEYEIKQLALRDNFFQVKSESRKREIAATVLKRLNELDEYLIEKLVLGSRETSKFIALYVLLKTDLLFFEFMNEVFKDKVLYGDMLLTDKDFSLFFQSKAKQNKIIASWTDYTFYKLKQVYIRILFEAGLLKNKKGDREIIPPLVEEDVLTHIKNKNDSIYLEAMGVISN